MTYIPGLNVTANGGTPTTSTALVASDGTSFTLAQLALIINPPVTATAATLSGVPGTAASAVAITGITCTLTPSNATAYASISVGGTEQTPRTSFTGTSVPSLTPATTGTATISIWAASTGGSALVTSSSITVTTPATGASFASMPTTGSAGSALSGGSVTFTPGGSSGYVVLHNGTAEQGSRTAASTGSLPTLTPSAAGTYTVKAFAASTGGTALATSGSITVAAAGYTITYSASGHPDIGVHFPSTAANPGSGGVTIFDGRVYVYDSGGSPPSTFDLTWTRSGSVTPTSGTGPNQYNTGNNRDLQTFTSSDLYSNQSTYPGLFDTSIAHSAIWQKVVGGDGGSGTYYGWFRVAGVWYQPAGFTVAVS